MALIHDLIAVDYQDLVSALSYYMNNKTIVNNTKPFMVEHVSDDRMLTWIRNFNNIELFNHDLNHHCDCLSYYGITIIPPNSIEVLIDRFLTEKNSNDRDNLLSLFHYARERNYYIVHHGI